MSNPAVPMMPKPSIGQYVTYQGAEGTPPVPRAEVIYVWPPRESADTPAGYLVDVVLPAASPGASAETKTRVPPDHTGQMAGSWRWGNPPAPAAEAPMRTAEQAADDNAQLQAKPGDAPPPLVDDSREAANFRPGAELNGGNDPK